MQCGNNFGVILNCFSKDVSDVNKVLTPRDSENIVLAVLIYVAGKNRYVLLFSLVSQSFNHSKINTWQWRLAKDLNLDIIEIWFPMPNLSFSRLACTQVGVQVIHWIMAFIASY